MKLGLVLSVLNHVSLDEALRVAAATGYQAVELPVYANNPHLDLEKLLGPGQADQLKKKIAAYGMQISALDNHPEGQLVLGPHHADTDLFFPGSAKEKIAYGMQRMKLTAQLANALEVPVVCGFCGCEDYSRWFPWPDAEGWKKMSAVFVERWNEILDVFQQCGVRFAHECHPKQFAYNLETAEEAVALLHHRKEWGYNLDPANLMLSGMDPVVFVQQLGDRIYHVHAKDAEIVAHNQKRSGLLAHGDWTRMDRGFRFRIPGWGQLPWKAILTELRLVNYDYVLSVEHEDPTMSRMDGLAKSYDFLKPLLIEKPFEGRWW